MKYFIRQEIFCFCFSGVDVLFSNKGTSNSQPNFILTRYAGKYGQYMAEYVISNIIAWERRYREAWDSQKKSTWYVEFRYVILEVEL